MLFFTFFEQKFTLTVACGEHTVHVYKTNFHNIIMNALLNCLRKFPYNKLLNVIALEVLLFHTFPHVNNNDKTFNKKI